jgi:hypothetical protein
VWSHSRRRRCLRLLRIHKHHAKWRHGLETAIGSSLPFNEVYSLGGHAPMSTQASLWWPKDYAAVAVQVSDTFTVSRVVLELVNFRHNYAADVTIKLRAPGGAEATIVEEPVRGAPTLPPSPPERANVCLRLSH